MATSRLISVHTRDCQVNFQHHDRKICASKHHSHYHFRNCKYPV